MTDIREQHIASVTKMCGEALALLDVIIKKNFITSDLVKNMVEEFLKKSTNSLNEMAMAEDE